MTLFVQVENNLGYHDSNFIMNINDETKVRKNQGFGKATNAKLKIGDEVTIKTPEWSLLRDSKARVISLEDLSREGLQQTRKMNLFQKHLMLFSQNSTSLGTLSFQL